MAKVNIKPLGDRVLLEICECKDEMKGGILIPDTAKEKPQEYQVVALGTGTAGPKLKSTVRSTRSSIRTISSRWSGNPALISLSDNKTNNSGD